MRKIFIILGLIVLTFFVISCAPSKIVAGEAVRTKAAALTIKPTCTETDLGTPFQEEYVPGMITFTDSTKNGNSFDQFYHSEKDYCKDNDFLIEYSCKNYNFNTVSISSTVYKAFFCKAGCDASLGACKVDPTALPPVPFFCTDSDGKNIHTLGTTVGYDSSGKKILKVEDFCSAIYGGEEVPSGAFVAELTCNAKSKLHSYSFECPKGEWCYGGVCTIKK